MATESSRKRAANVGHHQYGRLITLDDGTTAFQPLAPISDAEGNTAELTSRFGGAMSLSIDSEDMDSMQGALNEINENLKTLIALTKGMM